MLGILGRCIADVMEYHPPGLARAAFCLMFGGPCVNGVLALTFPSLAIFHFSPAARPLSGAHCNGITGHVTMISTLQHDVSGEFTKNLASALAVKIDTAACRPDVS